MYNKEEPPELVLHPLLWYQDSIIDQSIVKCFLKERGQIPTAYDDVSMQTPNHSERIYRLEIRNYFEETYSYVVPLRKTTVASEKYS